MKIGIVLRVLSLISLIVSLFMFLPLGLALWDGTPDARAFAVSLACGLLISLLLSLGGKRKQERGELWPWPGPSPRASAPCPTGAVA